MILHFAYVGAALLALALLAAWMFIVSRRHVAVRILGAATATALAASIWVNIIAVMGYAVEGLPVGKLAIVGFISDQSSNKIYLWLRQHDGPRAYVIPYDPDFLKKLFDGRRALQEAGGGQLMLGVSDGKRRRDHLKITLVPAIPEKE